MRKRFAARAKGFERVKKMIEVKDFTFRYREEQAPALSDINLTIPDGAFVGITGAAGSGKSTLTYALNGIIPHCYPGDFYGSVTVYGLDTCESQLTDISLLVGSVCQDIDSQMVSTVVEDEMLFGLENFGVAKDQVEARIVEALSSMGIADLRYRTIDSLSGGQKQKVAIASILAMRPRVLVLDEPTAELDPASSVVVFDLLAEYAREHKTTVVVVEQKIALLSDYADMLVVVDGGRIRYAASPEEVLEHADELLALGVNCPRSTTLMNRLRASGIYAGPVCRNVRQAACAIGALVQGAGVHEGSGAGVQVPAQVASSKAEGSTEKPASEKPAFAVEFRQVSAAYDVQVPILRDVSFSIERGEFVAFLGTNGAGKSTTMRLVNGLLTPTEGQVLVDGVPTTSLKTSQLALKVGFLFQNPDRQICCNTVREELLFGLRALGSAYTEDEMCARVEKVIDEFGFSPDADPFLLNRGTRQLLALASVVVVEPSIVVLDEPTTGLDYRECCKVMEAVERLRSTGATVIMVCHDMEVVADFAERVIVMNAGRVVADGATFEVLRDRAVCERASLVPPQIADISQTLAGALPALGQANTLDEMTSAICSLLKGGVR